MSKWHLLVDLDRCNSCNNCALATKDEYVGNDFPGYSAAVPGQGTMLMSVRRHERGVGAQMDVTHFPESCHHCADAPCAEADRGDKAIYQRADGIVIIDPERAKGRRDLVDACPFGQIHWNAESNLPQKWTFDAHLLDQGWTQPRCVQSCPTGAMEAVKIDDADMARRAKVEGYAALRSDMPARPRVLFRNHGALREIFVAGCLATKLGDEVLTGIVVELWVADERLAGTETDWLGEFKFDRIVPSDAGGELRIVSPKGELLISRKVDLSQTQCLETIFLDPDFG